MDLLAPPRHERIPGHATRRDPPRRDWPCSRRTLHVGADEPTPLSRRLPPVSDRFSMRTALDHTTTNVHDLVREWQTFIV